MSQERLTHLATLFIEKDKLDEINVDAIINDYASKSVKRNKKISSSQYKHEVLSFLCCALCRKFGEVANSGGDMA
jgi:hypothetical protein